MAIVQWRTETSQICSKTEQNKIFDSDYSLKITKFQWQCFIRNETDIEDHILERRKYFKFYGCIFYILRELCFVYWRPDQAVHKMWPFVRDHVFDKEYKINYAKMTVSVCLYAFETWVLRILTNIKAFIVQNVSILTNADLQ
jgi:hypothetical protein